MEQASPHTLSAGIDRSAEANGEAARSGTTLIAISDILFEVLLSCSSNAIAEMAGDQLCARAIHIGLSASLAPCILKWRDELLEQGSRSPASPLDSQSPPHQGIERICRSPPGTSDCNSTRTSTSSHGVETSHRTGYVRVERPPIEVPCRMLLVMSIARLRILP